MFFDTGSSTSKSGKQQRNSTTEVATMKLAFGIAFALLGSVPSTALAEKTTIYFVRHAEQRTTQTVVGEATSPYDAEWTGDVVQVTPVDLGDMEEEPTAGGRNLDEVGIFLGVQDYCCFALSSFANSNNYRFC